MRRATGVIVAGVAAIMTVAAFVAGYRVGRGRAEAIEAFPVLGTAPDYTLVNQLGEEVRSSSFAGKVQLVTFLAPYCTTYCPVIAHNLLSFERVLRAAGLQDRVQFVSFNVDAGHAGPPEMAAFLEQYGWDPHDGRWQYLTGTPAQIRETVTKGFFIDFREVSEAQQRAKEARAEAEGSFVPEIEVVNPLAERAGVSYDIAHNDALVVVDGEGRMRVFYGSADRVSNGELLAAVSHLLSSPRPSSTPRA